MAEKPLVEMPFPALGLDRRAGFHQQPPHTTPAAQNVRPYATVEGRERGGCAQVSFLLLIRTLVTKYGCWRR